MKTKKIITAIAMIVAIQGTVPAQRVTLAKNALKGAATSAGVGLLSGKNPFDVSHYIGYTTPELTRQFNLPTSALNTASAMNTPSAVSAIPEGLMPAAQKSPFDSLFRPIAPKSEDIIGITHRSYSAEEMELLRRMMAGPIIVDRIGTGFNARMGVKSFIDRLSSF